MGVSQNVTGTQFLFGGTLRPNLVDGQPILPDGDVTERIAANPTDNQYFNLAAFQAVPKNRFGNAPRTLPGVLSPFRTSFSMSAAKKVNLPGRAVAIAPDRAAQPVQHRPVGRAGELRVRQRVVRPGAQPGEQHAVDPVHVATLLLNRVHRVARHPTFLTTGLCISPGMALKGVHMARTEDGAHGPLTRRSFLERFGMVGGSTLVMSAMHRWELLGAQAGPAAVAGGPARKTRG